MLYLFFSVTGYQLICNQSLISCFLYFGVDISPYIVLTMLLYSLFIVFPLSLLEKVIEFKIFSLISIFSVVYICITILWDFPKYLSQHSLNSLKFYNFDLYFFSACTFALFSFTCHMNVATVFADMKNPNKKRMQKVNFRVCLFQLIIFIILAVVGYLSLLENTPLFIIQRKSPDSADENGYLLIGRILVCVVLMVTMPLFINMCRKSLQGLFLENYVGKPELLYFLFRKIGINFGILAGSLIISTFFPEVLVIFNFLGAFCAVFSYLFPVLLEVAISKHSWYT